MSDREDKSTSRPASEKSLGPLKTGREKVEEEVKPSSPTPVEMTSREPLPPISSDLSSPKGEASNSDAGSRKPTILAYRREISDADLSITPEKSKEKTEKKPDSGKSVKSQTEAKKHSVAVECQTEWSWMEDMKQHQMIKATGRIMHFSRASSIVSQRSEAEVEEEFSSPHSSARDRPRHKASAGTADSADATETLTSPPYPSRDDEYGIPILTLETDSEHSSDEDSLYHYKYADSEAAEEDPDTLPSIGPPEILKYQRENAKLDESETPRVASYSEDPSASGGMFEGVCEFCQESIKPFPSIEDQKSLPPDELYCCNNYRDFVQYIVAHPMSQNQNKDEKIDIKPHPPYGSKQARKDAKERAAQRMRERELARQQAAIAAGLSGTTPAGGGGGGGGGANFYQFARQMKTINYQLSSQKCLEDGWTIRPPSPLYDHLAGCEVFEPEPLLPPWAEGGGKPAKRMLIFKYYENGAKFLIIFPDGTGNVYYPSGRIAITISSLEQGLYTYILQDDTVEQNVLGVFKSDGHALSNYSNHGGTRLHLDQIGGIELDSKGSRKRKWSWKEQIQHVHAPPIQPITFALTPAMSIRVKSQENITLTFTYGQRSCRFQVGAKLKPVTRQPTQIGDITYKLVGPQYFVPPGINMDDMYRQECLTRIETLLAKVHNLLRFPNSPKVNRFPTPPHLTARMKKIEEVKFLHGGKKKEDSENDSDALVISVN